MDDYSKLPKSLGEARAEKEQKASLWTPRDALISVLRDIDSGKVTTTKIIIGVCTNTDDGFSSFSYYLAGTRSYLESVGLLEEIKQKIMGR